MTAFSHKTGVGKRVFVHVGVAKTGTSALQAFLSSHAQSLERHGISYPFREGDVTISEGTCSGNLIHVMLHFATSDGYQANVATLTAKYLPRAVEAAIKESTRETVIVSGECIAQHLTPELVTYFQELSRRHRVTFLGFVRDVHDLTLSGWKQRVKTGEENRDLREYVETAFQRGSFSVRKLGMLLNAGLDVRVRNYDIVRHDLASVFAAEIGFDLSQTNIPQRMEAQKNLSLSFWQAKALVMAQATSARLSALLVNRFQKNPDKRRDPYCASIDKDLLKYLEDDIALLNKHLALEERLRDQPRGETEESRLGFPADIVEQILQVVHDYDRAETVFKQAPEHPHLPKDFDPEVYLLRNPDVAAARMDPVYHYIHHGRFEGRIYKGRSGELG